MFPAVRQLCRIALGRYVVYSSARDVRGLVGTRSTSMGEALLPRLVRGKGSWGAYPPNELALVGKISLITASDWVPALGLVDSKTVAEVGVSQ